MAYEYESKLKNRLLDLEFDTWEETAQFEREYRELERVYRKAKAFDAIVNIEDDFVKYHGFSPCVEEYTEEVEDIISKYLEDKQND